MKVNGGSCGGEAVFFVLFVEGDELAATSGFFGGVKQKGITANAKYRGSSLRSE